MNPADSATAVTRGFAPIAREDARVLILGSLPSVASVEAGRYYAHARNAFWPIMRELLGADGSYEQRCAVLISHRVAVWDVLHASVRPGSLDAAIDKKSAQENDFRSFFGKHANIHLIAFNGKTSERLYRQRVLHKLEQPVAACVSLPSTSPAYAAMGFDEKLLRWQQILDVD